MDAFGNVEFASVKLLRGRLAAHLCGAWGLSFIRHGHRHILASLTIHVGGST